tara:strand:- start:45 stop:188 length:144 start_codon:yes stop_codon:yes gene_type:complete
MKREESVAYHILRVKVKIFLAVLSKNLAIDKHKYSNIKLRAKEELYE